MLLPCLVGAQGAGQTMTLDMIPVGIQEEVEGSVSFQLPSGYEPFTELHEITEHEEIWGEQPVSWKDYHYGGRQVVQTVTSPDGYQDERTGDLIDGLGFGGGVVYIRGNADIGTEAEKNQRPYMEGEIHQEGEITVSGDGVSYQGYYYLSSWTEEEEPPWEWVYVKHALALRIALTETEPLHTLWVHFWTWGPDDFTNSKGDKYTFTLDDKPVKDTHREYLDRMLSSISISGWTAPSAAPVTTPVTTPEVIPEVTPAAEGTLDQSQTSTPGNTGLEGDWWLSQGFIPSMSTLTSAEVYVGSVHANLSYSLTLEVRGDSNGLPSSAVLASTSVTIAQKGWEWTTFDIPDLSVNPGTRYHLVLHSTSNYHAGLDSTNPYPDGHMGYSTDAGAAWKTLHDNTNYDMAFKIYGLPSEETPAPEETGGGFFSCSAPAEEATAPSGKQVLLSLGSVSLPLGTGLWLARKQRRRPR